MKDLIEVIEWIKDGVVYRKTINGVEVPPEILELLPTVVQRGGWDEDEPHGFYTDIRKLKNIDDNSKRNRKSNRGGIFPF